MKRRHAEEGSEWRSDLGLHSLVRQRALSTVRFGGLVGESESSRSLFGRLERIAETDATAYFEGERGTGKKEAARAVHAQSARSSGPFLIVSCAAPDAEVALFGDADGTPGAMRRAECGTLYLEDVNALCSSAQLELARALETQTLTATATSEARTFDVRVIASAQEPLRKRVQDGTFRLDLCFRFSVLKVCFAPLRERRDDLLPIIRELLERSSATEEQIEMATSATVLAALRQHALSDNVRGVQALLEETLERRLA